MENFKQENNDYFLVFLIAKIQNILRTPCPLPTQPEECELQNDCEFGFDQDCNCLPDTNDPTNENNETGINIDLGLLSALNQYLEPDLTPEQMDWIFENQENIDFAQMALDALQNGGEADFEEKIILDPAFVNNDCLANVYSQMKNNSTSFSNYLENFLGETPVAHLRFNYDENFGNNQPNNTTALAITEPPQNYVINIIFNGDPNLPSSTHNKPKLIIAVAFIHEMIHAEIYRKMLSAAQLGNLDTTGSMTPSQQVNFVNNLRNNFPDLYDYYVDRWRDNWGHQLMAQHYVDIIKGAIAEYDNNAHSQETYEAIAWMGLYNTIAWNNLTPAEQTTLTENFNTFIQNDTNTCD